MKYTFEISIAGCSTKCAHCYVSGGPAPAAQIDEYKMAILKLNDILAELNGEIDVTLGNELFIHPRIVEIISFTHNLMPSYFAYDSMYVPTTGMALMRRKDKTAVLDALRNAGCPGFMLTLHGNKEHHNIIAENSVAYDSLVEAARWLSSEGFNIRFNMMVSNLLISDWESVERLIEAFPNSEKAITIPLYLPTERLRGYQQYRADYNDCMILKGRLDGIGADEEAFLNRVDENCEKIICHKLKNCSSIDYIEHNNRSPQWSFLNVTQNFDIYYGNAGLHTKYVGNLLKNPQDELIQQILALPANYDWSAYYSIEQLPSIHSIIREIEPIRSNYVYAGMEDCIYSWFDRVGIPSILL